ncbi:MAG: ABC transporter permease subunit [Saprospiraceae bacterium]
MSPVNVIAKRELASYFDSLIAYIIIIAFLGFTGFFTWLYGSDIFMRKQADLAAFFGVARWTLFFFIPAITMRQLAEEKKTGTIELLLTKAVTERQIILGKFLSCLLIVGIALLFTLPYYLTLTQLGKVDHGAIFAGYFGLILMSATYISIGIFASSITNNQIIAFLLALLISMFFQLLFDVMTSGTSGFMAELFSTFSLSRHYDSIVRGVLDSKDLVYFATLTIFWLILAEVNIQHRR